MYDVVCVAAIVGDIGVASAGKRGRENHGAMTCTTEWRLYLTRERSEARAVCDDHLRPKKKVTMEWVLLFSVKSTREGVGKTGVRRAVALDCVMDVRQGGLKGPSHFAYATGGHVPLYARVCTSR